jgi:hypothetical protein
MRRPFLTLRCVANTFASDGERIAEFSFPAAADGRGELPGGLISLRYRGDGLPPLVNLYRVSGCEVDTPAIAEARRQAGALRSLIGRAAEYVGRFADMAGEPDCGDCRALLAELEAEGSDLAAETERARLRQLVADLWDFIDNTADDAPDRQDKFFALRVRVRTAGAPENGFQ